MNATRTAVVTGASRGLGRALARALARERWRLLVDGRDPAALERVRSELARSTTVIALSGDVADPDHRSEIAAAARTLGGLDAVVNNAGTLGPSPQPALLDYPLDILTRVYAVNAIAPIAVLQAVRPALRAGAVVVNVTSDAGAGAYAGWGGYGSSKAALEHLTRVLAVENPELRVHHVDPGDMRTDMHQAAFPGEDISDRDVPEASVPGILALLEGDHPSGRYVAKDVAIAMVTAGAS